MSHNAVSKFFVFGLLFLSLILLTRECIAQTIRLPDNTHFVIAVTLEGERKIVILDTQGNPIPDCLLCTPEIEDELKKNNKTCKEVANQDEKIRDKLICDALTEGTIQDVISQISITEGHGHKKFRTVIEPGPKVTEVPVPHSH